MQLPEASRIAADLPEGAPGQAHVRLRLSWNVTGVEYASDIEVNTAFGHACSVAKPHLHFLGIGTARSAALLMESAPILDPTGLKAARAHAQFIVQRLFEREVRGRCANLN